MPRCHIPIPLANNVADKTTFQAVYIDCKLGVSLCTE